MTIGSRLCTAITASLLLPGPLAMGSVTMLRGKVVMEDGSPPPQTVGIERLCVELNPVHVSSTNKRGEYIWPVDLDLVTLSSFSGSTAAPMASCFLKAEMKGYDSSSIDLTGMHSWGDPHLAPLVLTRRSANPSAHIFEEGSTPRAAMSAWNRAGKAALAKNWTEAEQNLLVVVQKAPRFSQGWNALGVVSQNQNKIESARDAYRRAIETNPKLLAPYLLLSRADIDLKEWDEAAKTAGALIQADPKHRYPEAFVNQAVARFYLKDIEGAEASAKEALRLDKRHEIPRAEYVLGLILEGKRDYAGAGEHMRNYLALEPKASDAAAVRARMENFGKAEATVVAPELALAPSNTLANVDLSQNGEAWVPGGMKALAAAAHIHGDVSYQSFFAEYCRALVRETSPNSAEGISQFGPTLQAYMATVSELARLGERRDETTVITLALGSDAHRKDSERILALLGWKLAGTDSLEPGDRAADSVRQILPAYFGIDEIAMQEALEAGRSFQFEIPSESARLMGGEAWGEMLKGLPAFPGGIAEAFARDGRLAKTYAGLGAMGTDTAAAVVSGIGLRELVTQHADVLALFSDALTLSGGEVATPGGVEAEPAWKKLAGVSPKQPPAFFRALLLKDRGRLAAFYAALARSDAAHQLFFTKTPARADRFYAWYRDSREFQFGVARAPRNWRTELLQELPLDEAGNVRFPGGRRAWTSSSGSDEEAVLSLGSIEALVPVARIEERRHVPLDERSATLLAHHYAEWRALLPYFEKLPGLARAEFEALVAFGDAVASYVPARRHAVLGEWHSLVELIARGVQAGSLDTARSAILFRGVCDGLRDPDHSTKAVEALREIAGGEADVDEAVPGRLLRLSPDRRAAFDRVRALQDVPRVAAASGDPDKTVIALSGFVYAASLDPEGLLINEDPHLLRKHRFDGLFAPSELISSSDSPGSHLRGGFAHFDEVARNLAHGGKARPASTPAPASDEPAAGPSPVELGNVSSDVVFRAEGRLVEVYATVTDRRGRYADDLTRDQFAIMEQGRPQDAVAFEPRSSEVSCALLLDTTGSMELVLPALKNAALKLIGELRPVDSVAVYSFSEAVSELQPFTTDKSAAKRAVLRTQAFGKTALYDALARVNRDLSGRSGKKVIVMFTDGDDNASTLTTGTAIQRAKAAGVPVYTIAQGAALFHPEFLKQLASVSKATGGVSFVIHEPSEIRSVFEHVSEDLMHGYLLQFRPAPAQDRAYRAIEVVVRGSKSHKVRAREGYYPE